MRCIIRKCCQGAAGFLMRLSVLFTLKTQICLSAFLKIICSITTSRAIIISTAIISISAYFFRRNAYAVKNFLYRIFGGSARAVNRELPAYKPVGNNVGSDSLDMVGGYEIAALYCGVSLRRLFKGNKPSWAKP